MNKNHLYTPSDIFAVARDEAEVTNLMNTDVYKFLMLDFILTHPEYKDINVKWQMTIRSKWIRTAEVIPLPALLEQLEATKMIPGLQDSDISYLRWMTNPDGSRFFREETLAFLKTFRLPEYKVGIDANSNYTLEFTGPWKTSMMREIYGLKIINSLYQYHYVKKAKLSNSGFHQIINTTIHRLYEDIATFKTAPKLKFMEFGTRRSLSTDFQRMVFEILTDSIPDQCTATSNILLSREFGKNNPKGTNAHELRMIPTALHDDPQKIVETMYDIDRQWMDHFNGLGILLPDTYGTTFYLNNCPEDIALKHSGNRFDSKDPMIGIPEYLAFLQKWWIDSHTKLWIPSDGLTAKSSVEIFNRFKDDLNITTGNGTHLSNNTAWTRPESKEPFGPFGSFSVVVKPAYIERPDGTRVSCVKLSDNPEKAVWEKSRVELFKEIFGNAWVKKQDVLV